MVKWQKLDIKKPPKNWCLIRIKDNIGDVLAKWSIRGHCWIGMDLEAGGLIDTDRVSKYLETDYHTLTDMLYRPREKHKEPKVYDPKNDLLKGGILCLNLSI